VNKQDEKEKSDISESEDVEYTKEDIKKI